MKPINVYITTVVTCIIVLVALLCSLDDTPVNTEYKDMRVVVDEVTNLSSICKHGATLILIGRYEQATQYNEDFGSCMRSIVLRVQLER